MGPVGPDLSTTWARLSSGPCQILGYSMARHGPVTSYLSHYMPIGPWLSDPHFCHDWPSFSWYCGLVCFFALLESILVTWVQRCRKSVRGYLLDISPGTICKLMHGPTRNCGPQCMAPQRSCQLCSWIGPWGECIAEVETIRYHKMQRPLYWAHWEWSNGPPCHQILWSTHLRMLWNRPCESQI